MNNEGFGAVIFRFFCGHCRCCPVRYYWCASCTVSNQSGASRREFPRPLMISFKKLQLNKLHMFMWNVECGMWDVESGMCNVEYGLVQLEWRSVLNTARMKGGAGSSSRYFGKISIRRLQRTMVSFSRTTSNISSKLPS